MDGRRWGGKKARGGKPALLVLAWLGAAALVSGSTGCRSQSESEGLGRVAWIRGDSLFARAVPSGAPRLLAVAAALREPRWSPSGQWLALRTDSALHLVRWNGSGGQKLSAEASGSAWAPRDDRLAYIAAGNLIVARAGGVGVVLFARTAAAAAAGLAWSPDGGWIAFGIVSPPARGVSPAAPQPPRLLLQPARGGSPRSVSLPAVPLAGAPLIRGWTGDGAAVLVGMPAPAVAMATAPGAGMPVYAIPVHALTDSAGSSGPAAASAGPQLLADSVLPGADCVAPAPSQPGVALVAGPGAATWRRKAVLLAAAGRRTTLTAPGRAGVSPAWAPDGSRLAWAEMPDADLPPGAVAGPSLQGRRIVVAAINGRNAPARPVGGEAGRQEAPRWTADGRHLLYVRIDAAGAASLRLWAEQEPERSVAELAAPPAGAYGYVPWSAVLDYWPGPPRRDLR